MTVMNLLLTLSSICGRVYKFYDNIDMTSRHFEYERENNGLN